MTVLQEVTAFAWTIEDQVCDCTPTFEDRLTDVTVSVGAGRGGACASR